MGLEYLTRILDHKKKILKTKESFYDSLKDKLDSINYTRYSLFKQCISKPGRINLIAEIKKASPSRGLLREDFDLMGIAKIYEKHQAGAISVLTEDKYFLGKPTYVKQVSEEIKLPVLTKDFIIDEGQIYEARYYGASAILLIVAILEDDQLTALYQKATELDLDCLVEVHNEQELDRALKLDAEIIGINNRNLNTFEVDLQTSETLIPKIPKDKIIVAESGFHTHEDILRIYDAGANAVLIGEAFMKAEDVGAKVQEMMQGP